MYEVVLSGHKNYGNGKILAVFENENDAINYIKNLSNKDIFELINETVIYGFVRSNDGENLRLERINECYLHIKGK